MSNFEMLHQNIQNGIIKKLGWKSLTPVQEKTIPEIINGKNLIVLAPTAGGKTEAAFLPILSEVMTKELTPVSVLYISPIKALLNNQEERLRELSSFIYGDVFKWHGDVEKTNKNKFIKNKAHVLMITPESLEVILMNKLANKEELFKDLHYIVIDEIHAFAESERGTHLMALIERVQKFSNYDIQRIGLSATVGNPDKLLEWLQGSSTREKSVVYPGGEKKNKKIEIRFCKDEEERTQEILKRIVSRKALVFSNNRKDAELLKLRMEKENIDSYIHHSSINKFFREKTEESFKIGKTNTIIATNTLELGIDIGALDVVLHLEMPSSVSSFLQKLGRTGRREGKVSHFVFLPSNEENLVMSIAILNLAMKKWVENVFVTDKAYDILLHQTLTICLSSYGADIDDIFNTLSKVYSFSGISNEEYRYLIEYMVKETILHQDKNRIFLGDKGQSIFGKMNYIDLYSTFETPSEFTVNNKGKSIGTIESWFVKALGEKFNFILGGKCWETVKIDQKKFIVYVEPSPFADPPKWVSGGKMISYELSQEYFNIIVGDTDFVFLNNKEKDILEEFRSGQKDLGLEKASIYVEERNTDFNFYTYLGDKLNYTMGHSVTLLDDRLSLKGVGWKGFSIKKNKSNISLNEIKEFVEKLIKSPEFFDLDIKNQLLQKLPDNSFSKYQKYLPIDLRKKMIYEYLYDFDFSRIRNFKVIGE